MIDDENFARYAKAFKKQYNLPDDISEDDLNDFAARIGAAKLEPARELFERLVFGEAEPERPELPPAPPAGKGPVIDIQAERE